MARARESRISVSERLGWKRAIAWGAAACLFSTTAGLAAAQDVGDLLALKESIHPNGSARFIDATELQALPEFKRGDLKERAIKVANFYRHKLGLTEPRRQLEAFEIRKDFAGNAHVRFEQRHRGLAVAGTSAVVHFRRDGAPTSVTATIVPDVSVDTQAATTGGEAARISIADVSGDGTTDVFAQDVQLVVYNDGLVRGGAGDNFLAFKVTVVGPGVREFVFVDALSGTVLDRFTGIHSNRNRLTYDMHQTSNYGAATLERSENGPPSGDADVDDAHDFAGDTYDFYFHAYGRDSIDDNGFTLRSYTHYFSPSVCPNAFWDGIRMTYCNGFPTDDVTSHEITHGVTENTAGLIYQYQSGALNESLSDIFGEGVDLTNGAGNDSEAVKWLMGEDLPIFGAIRDMSHPPAFGDPDKVSSPNYYCGSGDNGGVHTNSGVPNKNFFLLTEGGFFNGRVVLPLGLTKAAAIHYQALTNYLGPNTQFSGYFISLWRSCLDLIGQNFPDPIDGSPSGEILTFGECVNVLRAGVAVEFLTPAC